MFEAIWLDEEINSCQSETELDVNFRFRKCTQCTIQSKNKELQAACSMKSGRIVAHENMHFSNCTITKQKSRSLRLKLVNSWAALFEMQNSFTAAKGLLYLTTARALKRLNCFHSEYSKGLRATVYLITWRMIVVTLAFWGSLRWDDGEFRASEARSM